MYVLYVFTIIQSACDAFQFRGQCAPRLGFSIVVRIVDGKAERLADNFFAVSKNRAVVTA